MTGHPDDPRLPQPVREVIDAAALLQIREYDLFAIAHTWWFGREGERDLLERRFAAYMFRHEVPPWLRQHAREVLQSDLGRADVRRRLNLPNPLPAQPPRHGRLTVAATMAVIVAMTVLLLRTPYHPETSVPAWPEQRPMSCDGGGAGLRALEGLAYALSGRDLPDC